MSTGVWEHSSYGYLDKPPLPLPASARPIPHKNQQYLPQLWRRGQQWQHVLLALPRSYVVRHTKYCLPLQCRFPFLGRAPRYCYMPAICQKVAVEDPLAQGGKPGVLGSLPTSTRPSRSYRTSETSKTKVNQCQIWTDMLAAGCGLSY